MTTDPTPLQERIERALVLSPYVRGQLSKIGPVMKRREAERIALTAAVLPEVRKAQADALRDAAEEWRQGAQSPQHTVRMFLYNLATDIEKED